MNIKKIGLFLAELRREKGLTQEQLGCPACDIKSRDKPTDLFIVIIHH